MSDNNIPATLSSKPTFSLAPQDLDQAMRFADIIAKSSIIPKDFTNNPGNVLVAIQWGMELGLQPMQAMQNIAVINGRPSLWGDAVIGLVRSSPLCEYVIEEDFGDKSVCRVKRRGEDEQIRIFTDDDAKKAGLLGKQGPWTQYPKRMRQMRARSWALRDVFPDVLRGMPVAEEVMDMQEKDITPARPSSALIPPALPAYSQADFDKNLPSWTKLIEDGKQTPHTIIAKVESKAVLSEEQKAVLLLIKKKDSAKASAEQIEKVKTWAADLTVPESDVCEAVGAQSINDLTPEQAEKAVAFLRGE